MSPGHFAVALAVKPLVQKAKGDQMKSTNISETSWKSLYRAGEIAALIAAIVFRRNIGAEVSLFTGAGAIPHSAVEWFSLLQTNPFVGMSFLAVFDVFNYFLEGLVFLALGAALWQVSKSRVTVAIASGLVGIAVSFATNISLSMMSLSQQFAASSSEAQKSALLSAGQALLALNGHLTNFPGTGAYLAWLLIALAGLAFSSLLLSSNRATAIVGLLAAGCDLAYCLTFPISPTVQAILMSFGGAFWMIWHLLVAYLLLKRAKELK
jgi:hypothetical protein